MVFKCKSKKKKSWFISSNSNSKIQNLKVQLFLLILLTKRRKKKFIKNGQPDWKNKNKFIVMKKDRSNLPTWKTKKNNNHLNFCVRKILIWKQDYKIFLQLWKKMTMLKMSKKKSSKNRNWKNLRKLLKEMLFQNPWGKHFFRPKEGSTEKLVQNRHNYSWKILTNNNFWNLMKFPKSIHFKNRLWNLMINHQKILLQNMEIFHLNPNRPNQVMNWEKILYQNKIRNLLNPLKIMEKKWISKKNQMTNLNRKKLKEKILKNRVLLKQVHNNLPLKLQKLLSQMNKNWNRNLNLNILKKIVWKILD